MFVCVIRTSDRDGVDAPVTIASPFGAQKQVMGINDLPVGRSVPIARAVNGFIAGDGQNTGIGTGIRDRIVDCYVHEIVIWGARAASR